MDSFVCPICDREAIGAQMIDQDAYGFTCDRCGEYVIECLLMATFQAKSVTLAEADRSLVSYLSAHTRRSPRAVLDRNNWRALALARKTVPFTQKRNALLELLHSRTPRVGALVTLDLSVDAPLVDAGSPEEMGFLLNDLMASGQVARGPIYDAPAYSITGRGLEYLESEQETARSAKQESDQRHADAVTGLPTRAVLDAELAAAVSRCATDGLPIAVAFLDLDNFKPVNDSLGHPAGDGVLRAIGALLNRVVAGRGMIVGRYGGDEFVVAAPNCTAVELHAIAERVLNAIAADQHCEPAPGLRIGCSIGIACAAGNKTTPADLIKAADAACYAAKRAGKARIAHWSDQNSGSCQQE